jgi:hypothetical protein
MRITKTSLLILIIVIILLRTVPVPISPWSLDGHQVMTKHAIEWLPSPWRQFFTYYDWFLADAVAYPDTHYRGADPNEAPRHYIDLEVWSPEDPSTGTLPQAVEEFTSQMQLAIEAGNWNDAFLFAGRVAHYVEDDTQPYHTTVNYNPVNKAGVGLHETLDSSIMARLAEIQIQTPSRAEELTPIENLTEFALGIAVQSHSFLSIINQTLIDEGLDWSPELTEVIENRTNTAIAAVARVWYTAIARANPTAPEIPQPNELSVIIESASPMDDGLVTIRLRVADSLGVNTYADVALKTSNAIFRAQVANAIPPVGEYVIVSETGLHPGDALEAERDGYVGASVVLNVALTNTASESPQISAVTTSETERAVRPVPTVTVVALAVMLAGILALTVLRKTSRDS